MSQSELRQREIIEKNRKEIKEIEEIQMKDEKTSKHFRLVMAIFSMILCGLKLFLTLRTFFVNGLGGKAIANGDIHYRLLHYDNAYVISFLELFSGIIFLHGLSIHQQGKIILKYIPYKILIISVSILLVVSILFFGIIGGCWIFGFNLLFVIICWYADKTIVDVDTQITSFLNEHLYQN